MVQVWVFFPIFKIGGECMGESVDIGPASVPKPTSLIKRYIYNFLWSRRNLMYNVYTFFLLHNYFSLLGVEDENENKKVEMWGKKTEKSIFVGWKKMCGCAYICLAWIAILIPNRLLHTKTHAKQGNSCTLSK